MSKKMTKRDRVRQRHGIEEIEKSIFNHPLPEEDGRNFIEKRSYLAEVPAMHQKASLNEFGRLSKGSVMSESSEAETIVSQSYTSRSLSSASSWTDDVYEEETAQKVQHLFGAIDALLYEGIELPKECQDLHGECHYWRHTFPHLRINGIKLKGAIKETSDFINASLVSFTQNESIVSTTIVSGNSKRSPSGKPEEALSLMVQGISLEPLTIPAMDSDACDACNASTSSYEEIIEQHGEYEELIAVDFSDEKQVNHMPDEIHSQTDVEIQLHQQIMKRLIKDIWNETVSRLRPLLVKYISVLLQGDDHKHDVYTKNKLPEKYTIGETSPTRFPTAQLTNSGFGDLQGLLTISSKTLLNRNFDKNSRNITQTSAPPAMVGARLSSPHRILNRSSRGRLAPLERHVRTSIPTSRTVTVLQDNWKTPQQMAPPPVSPHSWGRHFPLPPIDSRLPTLTMPKVASVQKLKPTCSAIIRMLSGSSNKRGAAWDASKTRTNASIYSPAPASMTNPRTSRLLSAQMDTMRSVPASYAAFGERVKSSSKFTEIRALPETVSKGRGNETQKKDRLQLGHLCNNFERRTTNR